MKKEYELPCVAILAPDKEDILTESTGTSLNLFQIGGEDAPGGGDVMDW